LVKSNNEKSDFTLELTDEQVNGYARAEYLVFMDKGEGYYWPVYKGKDVNLNGNILNASINNNAFKIVDDGDEYLLPLIETYNNEDYIKYIIYGTIEDISSENISDWKIENIELSLILDKTTKKITVGNAIVNNSVDLPNTVVVNLDEWQYISFGATSRKLVDENGNVDMDLYQNSSNGVYEGVQITIDELANFKLTNFNDGNGYYCTFKIYDVDNNYYYSKLIKMN